MLLRSMVRLVRLLPRKRTNVPENQWLEDVFPIEIVHFLGDMLVFGSVCFIKRVVPFGTFGPMIFRTSRLVGYLSFLKGMSNRSDYIPSFPILIL